MTARSLPIVLGTVIALGATFTFAVNELLGGSVDKAPVRAAPAAGPAAVEQPSDSTRRVRVTYDNPRRLRNPLAGVSTDVRRHPRSPRSAGRSSLQAPAPSQPVAPSTTTPSTSAPTSSTPATSPPSPERPSTPKKGGGSGNFYSTG
jgi:hypothetical protein